MSFVAPKIRFKDDDCNDFPDWEEKKLGEVVTCLDNLRRPVNATEREKMKGDIPYYGANGIQGYVNDFIFDEDLTLLAEDGGNFDEFATRPIAQRVTGKAWVNNHAHILRADPSDMTPAFLFHSLVHKDIRKYINGSSRAKLNKGDMLSITMTVPDVPEQTKIADFLTAVDRRVDQLIQKKALLDDYKKGVMQQLFTQAIRFKDDNGNDFPDWEEKKLGEVFERLKRKNKSNNTRILTISAQDGLVDQKDYFDRSIASKDASGYYLLRADDFAYNKSYSKGYPMGAIKRLTKYETGSVSPLYICFCANDSGSPEFFSHYFDAGLLNREIHRIAQEGVRNHGLLNVSVVEFFRDLVVQLPSRKEQTRIADFLSAIDRKIESVATQITETQTFKRGLLQQMFV